MRVVASFLLSAGVILAACGGADDQRSAAITPAPLTATSSSTVLPSASPMPREIVTAFITWMERVEEAARPLGPLLDLPRPTDARWRTELGDAGTAVKRAVAQRPNLFPPACYTRTMADVDQLVTALGNIPDQLLATGDTLSPAQVERARQIVADIGAHLDASIAGARKVSC